MLSGAIQILRVIPLLPPALGLALGLGAHSATVAILAFLLGIAILLGLAQYQGWAREVRWALVSASVFFVIGGFHPGIYPADRVAVGIPDGSLLDQSAQVYAVMTAPADAASRSRADVQLFPETEPPQKIRVIMPEGTPPPCLGRKLNCAAHFGLRNDRVIRMNGMKRPTTQNAACWVQ